ncbi:MAG: TdeIII family type II restriction endonuclease [Methylobacter sp.]|nr:TdeIII family type II restriction endonuclease [Methylobacter sp.]MDP2098409.1 TdeIII family type II restriction endonuclease [Methylobacter sp.]MDP2429488.1 TdeIII family type II restriction endonuclease [Methylobacter sp.]MDP3055799.1 TdeIII family type II restriction endonuclease [Methylobacter sp.]MDP3360980.1 TdeIII family type II restriction endonuclease [Methylobacter sp.]
MTDKNKVAKAIQNVINTMMERVMKKVLVDDPFIKEKHHSQKPLYAALVPDEIFKGSHFERRFVTPFGGVWEKLAQVVAKEAHGECAMGYVITGNVGDERLRRIQEVLNKLEHSQKGQHKSPPNWQDELTYIKAGQGNPIPVSVVCDIYVSNPTTGKHYAFELKGPLPNSDQTKVSKEKMFKLLSMEPVPVEGAYYALPYNPYGSNKEDYKWTFPMRWFDMRSDPCVLIGDEFWDFIGGKGTYAYFVSEVNQLGKEYRERIYREFLEIDPPTDTEDFLLK